ncbi:hypothetical protein [[Kitasatospora] papulosa]|uniref:hypothetical protein n=1 Tax=[Kitasatospora] papulosa TaxID=1464011 RepID=UPI003857A012
MTVTCTPRELRIIADHVERLTKARVVNTQLGVPTTPDLMVVDFPNSFRATVHWTPGRRGTTGTERTAIARHARHRDCYQLDTASLEVAGGPRTASIGIQVAVDPAVVEDMARVAHAGIRDALKITRRDGSSTSRTEQNTA